jgi:hypothetical protein
VLATGLLFLTFAVIQIVRLMRLAWKASGVLLVDQAIGLCGCLIGIALLVLALFDVKVVTP